MKTIDNFDITTNPDDTRQRVNHLRRNRRDGRQGGSQFIDAGWFLSHEIAPNSRKQALTGTYVKLRDRPRRRYFPCNHLLRQH
ncbi:hypothetical protein LUI11_27275 [Bradyrhizobium diazoefficiens]|uniref:hypothetical protein n=1 Tax=Bradyrhizobium TaxID=374 RepID=UPI00138DE278|nr:hypothetical protein [Bradyrhizobium diazoefficiens]MCD9294686.1 hypothetical protein [Bradyrhizobium diazoefficiens]MCD9808890.1 hypothetical protein [Bradyrhizobium diazoefficiens]MCD9827679.1 hypothetical protein [Bradyrhizobium diazoefficiens]MCD9846035.1 hypothetical protein [Bradyrhizobium diazoefficiens]MCD9886483.1 hypothetical protein [Bradyrhizobium diazoefficiens]